MPRTVPVWSRAGVWNGQLPSTTASLSCRGAKPCCSSGSKTVVASRQPHSVALQGSTVRTGSPVAADARRAQRYHGGRQHPQPGTDRGSHSL